MRVLSAVQYNYVLDVPAQNLTIKQQQDLINNHMPMLFARFISQTHAGRIQMFAEHYN